MPLSWLDISSDSPFSLENIPFGVAKFGPTQKAVLAVAVGNHAINLAVLSQQGGLKDLASIQSHLEVFDQTSLNEFAALGRSISGEVRRHIQDLLRNDSQYPEALKNNKHLQEICIFPLSDVHMELPFRIGGFSDFYGGINHAYNAGALFRGQNGALLPNYLHLPMAYHSRTSSIVVSGTPIRRPWGQIVEDMAAAEKQPIFAPCRTMDFELEMGAFLCGGNSISDRISISDAEQNIFGFVLLNDWSARDVQRWEYVPLGPFNGKNFATTISSWVVHADALEPFRAPGVEHPGPLLPYLRQQRKDFTYDLTLEAHIISGKTRATKIITSANASKGLVWSFPQMLAHHTITGCPMQPGDLLGSGTISGTTTDSLGCLLEKTLNGTKPFEIEAGETRTWLEDGDEVVLKAYAGREYGQIGFGEARGVIMPAHEWNL